MRKLLIVKANKIRKSGPLVTKCMFVLRVCAETIAECAVPLLVAEFFLQFTDLGFLLLEMLSSLRHQTKLTFINS